MNAVGKKGEDVIVKWLIKKDYAIIERNWRVITGEIDIIAIEKGNILVFIEVKTLVNTTLDSLDIIVGKHKQFKISETAKHFLKNNRKYHKLKMRFDVIVLMSNPFKTLNPDIWHIKNAFGDCSE